MKRIILTLIMIMGIFCQPCYAADKKTDFSKTQKPDWELVSHDICIYTLAPDEFFLYKEYYPLLNGETRKVSENTSIEIYISKDNIEPNLNEVNVKIYNEDIEFYNRIFKPFSDDGFTIPQFNSDMFAGNVTLLLELVYKDGKTETQKFFFEKDDTYSDIKLKDEPIITKSGTNDVVVSFKVDNFSKLISPDKISVRSSSGKECSSLKDEKTKNVYSNIIVPFELDGLDRDYTVTIPAGCIMLDEGLNNELTFKVKNEIEYVVISNFLEYASPAADHIKYISGDKDVITVTMKINKDFKVDDTKQLLFNYRKVDYTAEVTNTGTILKFTADVVATQRYNVEFGEGLIVGANGETNGPKESYDFSVVDINTIDLPEKVIFTDLPSNHWAFDYITQLAMADIISGYEDKTFKPDGYVTRGELAKLLATSFNTTGKVEFDDTKGHWANQYISSVGEFIPTKGEQFRPDDKATRQDVAVALVNVMESDKGMEADEKILNFNDNYMIDKEYISQIAKAVSKHIISGYEDGTFRPQEHITRAEVATMISRLIQ